MPFAADSFSAEPHVIRIRCEFSSKLAFIVSPGNWIGMANDNDDFRDVIDMLSLWLGCSCVIWLLATLFGLSSDSLFG